MSYSNGGYSVRAVVTWKGLEHKLDGVMYSREFQANGCVSSVASTGEKAEEKGQGKSRPF